MPHLVTMAVAILMAVFYMIIALAIVTANVTFDPLSTNILASCHLRIEIKTFMIKCIMTIIISLAISYPKWVSISYVFLTALYTYYYICWVSLLILMHQIFWTKALFLKLVGFNEESYQIPAALDLIFEYS